MLALSRSSLGFVDFDLLVGALSDIAWRPHALSFADCQSGVITTRDEPDFITTVKAQGFAVVGKRGHPGIIHMSVADIVNTWSQRLDAFDGDSWAVQTRPDAAYGNAMRETILNYAILEKRRIAELGGTVESIDMYRNHEAVYINIQIPPLTELSEDSTPLVESEPEYTLLVPPGLPVPEGVMTRDLRAGYAGDGFGRRVFASGIASLPILDQIRITADLDRFGVPTLPVDYVTRGMIADHRQGVESVALYLCASGGFTNETGLDLPRFKRRGPRRLGGVSLLAKMHAGDVCICQIAELPDVFHALRVIPLPGTGLLGEPWVAVWAGSGPVRTRDGIRGGYARWRRNWVPNSDKLQSAAIASIVVRAPRDLFTYRPDGRDLVVSNFAISNSFNGRDRIIEFIRRSKHGVFTLPFDLSRVWPEEGLNGIYMRDGLFVRPSAGYEDHLFTPEDVTLSDGRRVPGIVVLTYAQFRVYVGRRRRMFKACDATHAMVSAWFVVLVGSDFDTHYQTPVNNQTHLVKDVSLILRRVYGHNNSTLHATRRTALLRYKPFCGPAPDEVLTYDDDRINGALRFGNVWVRVAVAGHMINMLMVSHFEIVDLCRYVDTVVQNIRDRFGQGASQPGFILEHQGELWHGFHDWSVAIDVYEDLCAEFKIPVKEDVLRFIVDTLTELVYEFPAYLQAEGYQAKHFVGAPAKLLDSRAEVI